MPALNAHSNVYNTCLLLLRKRGWRFWITQKGTAFETYWGERKGWDFSASSPLELLGLVAIYEIKKPSHYQEYWWREEGTSIYPHDIPARTPKYRSTCELDRRVTRRRTQTRKLKSKSSRS